MASKKTSVIIAILAALSLISCDSNELTAPTSEPQFAVVNSTSGSINVEVYSSTDLKQHLIQSARAHDDTTGYVVTAGSQLDLYPEYRAKELGDSLLIVVYAECNAARTQSMVGRFGIDAIPLVRMIGYNDSDLVVGNLEIELEQLCFPDSSPAVRDTPHDLTFINSWDRPIVATISGVDPRNDFHSELKLSRFNVHPFLMQPGDSINFSERYWGRPSFDRMTFHIIAPCPSELLDYQRAWVGDDGIPAVGRFHYGSITLARLGFRIEIPEPLCDDPYPDV